MALTLQVSAPAPVELEEYLEFLRGVDPHSRDSVIASASMLHALSQNKRLLVDAVNRELASCTSGADSRFYTAHSFVLGSVNGMTVRGNIWPTVDVFADKEHRRSHVNKVYAYAYPHDHNFDFLTVGWWGPGYVTDIYEYDYEAVDGFDGEEVALKFLERTSLGDGKVMFFREGRDVHLQHPPPQISVSLNLLVRTPLTALREQYVFDIDRKRIATVATGSDVARTVLAVRFAAIVGNSTTVEVLSRLADDAPNGRVRAAALEAMMALDPAQADEVLRGAGSDSSPHVRRLLAAAETSR